MTATTLLIVLMSTAAILLFLCWYVLRLIFGEVSFLSSVIRGFIHDYQRINKFEETLARDLEVRSDADLADWRAKHPR
jgi:hypothetical protein